HDQHADNFDHAGKAYAIQAPRLFTTVAGARRLGGRAEGLAPSQIRELTKSDGTTLRITATSARHGPAGIEPLSGDVIGFMLTFVDGTPPIYITGDTVWFDGVADVARRFRPSIVLLFAGSARTRGPFNLTMNTNDAIETAPAFPDATIIPVHYQGCTHFTESSEDLSNLSRRSVSATGCNFSNAAFRQPLNRARARCAISAPSEPQAWAASRVT